MSLEIIVALLGIAVTAAISIAMHLKAHPKRAIRYRVESASLISQGGLARGRLALTVDGKPVTNPTLVTLTIWSSGRADISSSSFDGGTPIVFDLGANIVDEVPGDTPSDPQLQMRPPNELIILPSLLRRRFQSRVRVVVDGVPIVSVHHSLVDIPVIADRGTEAAQAIETSRRRYKVTALSIGVATLVIALILLVISLVIYQIDQEGSLAPGVTAILLGMAALLTILLATLVRFGRWVKRNVDARSGIGS